MIRGRRGSVNLLTEQQRAAAIRGKAKERNLIERKAEEYISIVSNKWGRCRDRDKDAYYWYDYIVGPRPSDFQCKKLPYYKDLKQKSPQEVIEIYQKYQQQIKNPQMAQQRKKQQQQSKKRIHQMYAIANKQYANKQMQRQMQRQRRGREKMI